MENNIKNFQFDLLYLSIGICAVIFAVYKIAYAIGQYVGHLEKAN